LALAYLLIFVIIKLDY